MSRAFGVGIIVGAMLGATVLPDAALAQGYRHPSPPPYASRRVRCESDAGRDNYCPTNAWGRVWLERRLSKAPCRQYETWGADRDGSGVWVGNGCRAIFVVTPWGGPGYEPGSPPRHRPVHRVTCQSKGFRPNYCRLPRYGRVRLERRLSDAPCRQYDTWGVDGGGIWVDRGCAAVFTVW